MVGDAYPNDKREEGYYVQLATLMEVYSDEAIERVTNVITGIQTQCKFPPTLAEVKDHLEYEQVRIARIADMSGRKVDFKRAFVPPSKDPGCWANLFVPVYAPRYQEMIDRAHSFESDLREYRIDPEKCGLDWQGKPERRGGIHVAMSWYRPDMVNSSHGFAKKIDQIIARARAPRGR